MPVPVSAESEMNYDVFIISDLERSVQLARDALVHSEGGIAPDMIGSALTLPAAYQSLNRLFADGGNVSLIVADLHMAGFGMGGIEEMRRRYPQTPVVVMATLDPGALNPDRYRRVAARKGAAAFLTKDAPKQEFADTIKAVLQGRLR